MARKTTGLSLDSDLGFSSSRVNALFIESRAKRYDGKNAMFEYCDNNIPYFTEPFQTYYVPLHLNKTCKLQFVFPQNC